MHNYATVREQHKPDLVARHHMQCFKHFLGNGYLAFCIGNYIDQLVHHSLHFLSA